MRHGARAPLALAEGLLRLRDLGPLEVPDLRGEALQGSPDAGQGPKERRVAVSRDHLGGHGFRPEAQPRADELLHRGIQMGIGAHRSAELARAYVCERRFQPLPAPPVLGMVPCELEGEGGRLGVHSMSPPHAGDAPGPPHEPRERPAPGVERPGQQRSRIPELRGECGIEDVAGGHPIVNMPRLRSQALRNRHEECDHIVLHCVLDHGYPGRVEAGLAPQQIQVGSRNGTEPAAGFDGQQLDLQPAREAVLVRPDRLHLGDAVALYQVRPPNAGTAAARVFRGRSVRAAAVIYPPRAGCRQRQSSRGDRTGRVFGAIRYSQRSTMRIRPGSREPAGPAGPRRRTQ